MLAAHFGKFGVMPDCDFEARQARQKGAFPARQDALQRDVVFVHGYRDIVGGDGKILNYLHATQGRRRHAEVGVRFENFLPIALALWQFGGRKPAPPLMVGVTLLQGWFRDVARALPRIRRKSNWLRHPPPGESAPNWLRSAIEGESLSLSRPP